MNKIEIQADQKLLHACKAGQERSREEIFRALAMGASPDAKTLQGESALHVAAGARNLEAVKALLEAGANAEEPDRRGKKPLDVAGPAQAWSVAEALAAALASPRYSAGKPLSQALMMACEKRCPEIVKYAIAAGAEVDACDAKGATALMVAAAAGDFDTVNVLVEAGADPMARDKAELSSLDRAKIALKGWASNERLAVVDLLTAYELVVKEASKPRGRSPRV